MLNRGTIIQAEGEDYEVTAVSYQEGDDERHSYSYIIRPAAEVEKERQAEAAHQQELADQLADQAEEVDEEVPEEGE